MRHQVFLIEELLSMGCGNLDQPWGYRQPIQLAIEPIRSLIDWDECPSLAACCDNVSAEQRFDRWPAIMTDHSLVSGRTKTLTPKIVSKKLDAGICERLRVVAQEKFVPVPKLQAQTPMRRARFARNSGLSGVEQRCAPC